MEDDNGAKVTVTPEEHKMLRVGGLWFPLTMVVSMGIFIAFSAWTVSARNREIDTNFKNITDNIDRLTTTVRALADQVNHPGGEYLTRQQWIIICLQHQILNPEWKCTYSPRKSEWSTELIDSNKRE